MEAHEENKKLLSSVHRGMQFVHDQKKSYKIKHLMSEANLRHYSRPKVQL